MESWSAVIDSVTSPLGLAALSFLVIGGVAIKLFGKDDSPKIRLTAFAVLLAGLIGTVVVVVSSVTPPGGTRDDPAPVAPDSQFVGVEPGWLSSAAYSELYSEEVERRRYPSMVEGRLLDGEEQYRANWIAYPAGPFCFTTYRGLRRSEFNQRDVTLRQNGYRLEHQQTFEDATGELKYQATWSNQSEPCLE